MHEAASRVYVPAASVDPAAVAAAYDDCETLARRAAKNFYYSFLVLPETQRKAMCALYSFLRLTDDLGDMDAPVEERRGALGQWRRRLAGVLAGDFDGCDRWWLAFADTVLRYELPPALLLAVVDGVQSDLDVSRYATFADLYKYCYHVASAVGLLCIRVWRTTDDRADLPAEWCGVAFQMTNILRDVAEDHRRGRIYLPADEMQRFGLDRESWCERPTPAFLEFIRFQIDRTKDYYLRAEKLLPYVPPAGQAVLRAMIDIYSGVLRKIEADPGRILTRRVALSSMQKFSLAVRAFPRRFMGRSYVPPASGGETSF